MAQSARPLITETLLQELLLALLGFFGDVFVDNAPRDDSKSGFAAVPDPSACTVRVAAHIDWVSPPDRCRLREICKKLFSSHRKAAAGFSGTEYSTSYCGSFALITRLSSNRILKGFAY